MAPEEGWNLLQGQGFSDSFLERLAISKSHHINAMAILASTLHKENSCSGSARLSRHNL
jgi:hypothetical protein